MLEAAARGLRSALRDLDEGVQALLAGAPARAALARELLERDGGGEKSQPRERSAVARPRSAPRPLRRRVGPRRGSARLVLVR